MRAPAPQLIEFRQILDAARGDLIVAQCPDELPFMPKRIFFVHRVPDEQTRGEHAHRTCHQLLVCVKGRMMCETDDGQERLSFVLDRPSLGLYVPPMLWAAQAAFSPEAVLMALASHPYDESDYYRRRVDWLTALKLLPYRRRG